MKRKIFTPTIVVPLLGISLLFTACSYNQYGAVATGSSLGGMFGSSIGGLMGGPRGADIGTLAGMVIGGTIGAAATAPRNANNHTDTAPQKKSRSTEQTTPYANDGDIYSSHSKAQDIQFDTYHNPRYQSPMAAYNDLTTLEVSNVHFLDENNNHRLDYNEKAYIMFDITNRGSKILYNVAPNIVCNSKRVVISAPATVAAVMPGQGIRYKAAVVAVRKIKKQPLTFTLSFGTGTQTVVAKTFNL